MKYKNTYILYREKNTRGILLRPEWSWFGKCVVICGVILICCILWEIRKPFSMWLNRNSIRINSVDLIVQRIEWAMHTIEYTGGYLGVVFSGAVDQTQLFQALKEIFLHPEYPYTNSMWVFSGCECDFSNLCLLDLVRMIKAYYPLEATRKKTAIVTSSSTHHAMAQILCDEAWQEQLSFSLRAFLNRAEAETWLMEA